MGAWDADSFDNDTACDWAGNFAESTDLRMVFEVFDKVLDEDEYLDSTTACRALAACEVIARLKGNWGKRDPYSEDVDNWVLAHPMQVPRDYTERARAVVDRVLSPISELNDLWENDPDWLVATGDLRKRLAD